MTRDTAIDEFARAATTPFKVLAPAKTVARSMSLIGSLRLVYAQDWNSVAEMFNAAMTRVNGTKLSAVTLCRLYNLELKRLILVYAAVGRQTTIEMAAWSQQHPLHVFSQGTPIQGHTLPRPARQNNPRDGPPTDYASANARPDTPSVQDSLRLLHDMKNFTVEARKKP